ncbi:hypothetical protein DGWBC_0908 [Dehalogenimonas sp. WBC-2]|nr:hypothetical protein DGWBC_0908 [Dehalogenimonas sp. WBC-2]
MCATDFQDPNSKSTVDSKLRRVKALVFTVNGLFNGYALCQQNQRLLDALNKGFLTPKLHVVGNYLALYDVDMYGSENVREHMDTVYLRKTNILFVGEQATKPEVISPPACTLRKKKRVKVVVSLPQVTLKGELYSEMWEELQDTINKNDQFIPITDVELSVPLPNGLSNLPFVAVNIDYIVYVGN